MTRRCAVALSLALCLQASAAIDFTPIPGERNLEGMVFQQIIFHDDNRAIMYEPPRGWSCSGDSAKAKLIPPGLTQAQATLEQSPLKTPDGLDEAAREELKQAVLTSAPNEAKNTILVGEENNPVRIKQKNTYAVTISYSYFGQDYLVSVLFANLGDTQLRFRTVARKEDFEKVQRSFRASLFTLQWQ